MIVRTVKKPLLLMIIMTVPLKKKYSKNAKREETLQIVKEGLSLQQQHIIHFHIHVFI
jgi:hypothetical protein